MLDIQFIRDNRQLVQEKSKQKGYDVDIDQLLEADGKRRELIVQIEELRQKRNDMAQLTKNQRPTDEQIAEGKRLKEAITKLEAELEPVETRFTSLLKAVPNMPLDDVPVGQSEEDNIVAKEAGVKREFAFTPKTHWEIGEARGLIDKQRAAKVAGSRFAYLVGGLVELQFAIIQWVMQSLGDEKLLERLIEENSLSLPAKPFVPILPPYVLRTGIYDAMDRLEPRDDRYQVGEAADDLWLQGSAEHVLGPMYYDETLPAEELPIRYIGYATSFRREAGTYGKDTEGIVRMHQFDKLEMEVFSSPATGLEEHRLLVALQEHLVSQLELPYRVLNKCTYDIGKPNARGIDIEVWFPGRGQYLETHTADYMTDYQARRLKTRVKTQTGDTELVHTNDATAFALGRILAAIMENYQTEHGKVIVPKVLRPFVNGKSEV